jgi:SAM-dependent methyltransferase
MLIQFFVFMHNVSYKIIAKLAIKENGGVHPKHEILNYHQFFIDNILSDESVIDIGCGKGENAYDIAKKAKQAMAIDIKESNIQYAKKRYQRDNLEYVVGDVLTYNFDRRFDKIVFSNVLEHIDERVDFLMRLHNIADVILLRVPMLDRDWLAVYKKNKGFEYRLDPTHFIEYTLDILKDELESSGWGISEYSIQFGEFWGVIHSNK